MSFTIIKEGMHQLNALMHLIIVAYFRLLNCINLAFLCLFKRVIIIEAVIIFIIKPVSLKL